MGSHGQPHTQRTSRLSRHQERIVRAHEISGFMNQHQALFGQGDEKNGQGVVFIYSLNLLHSSDRDRRREFTLREIAHKIDVAGLWFNPQIKMVRGRFQVGHDASCPPYRKTVDGRKQEVMYLENEFTNRGNSKRENYILDQLKSSVVTKKRSHDTIRKYIEETEDGYRLILPPPVRRLVVTESGVTSGAAAELEPQQEPRPQQEARPRARHQSRTPHQPQTMMESLGLAPHTNRHRREAQCRCGCWFTPPPSYRGSSPTCITCLRSNQRRR